MSRLFHTDFEGTPSPPGGCSSAGARQSRSSLAKPTGLTNHCYSRFVMR